MKKKIIVLSLMLFSLVFKVSAKELTPEEISNLSKVNNYSNVLYRDVYVLGNNVYVGHITMDDINNYVKDQDGINANIYLITNRDNTINTNRFNVSLSDNKVLESSKANNNIFNILNAYNMDTNTLQNSIKENKDAEVKKDVLVFDDVTGDIVNFIDKVNITGVKEPVTNEYANTSGIKSTDSNIVINSARWLNTKTNKYLKTTDVFEENTEYKLEIVIEFINNSQLSDKVTGTITSNLTTKDLVINGNTLSSTYKSETYYSVKFVVDGNEETIRVKEGTIISKADPLKDGYTFQGWFNKGTIYEFSKPVTSNLELVAEYNPNVYTISLDDTNEIKLLYDHNYQKNNAVITKVDVPSKNDYVFAGYYENSDGTGKKYIDEVGNILALNTEFLSDRTIYAKWILNTTEFTVKFNNSNISNQIVVVGNKVIEPAAPIKEGYTLENWYLDSEFKKIYDFDSIVYDNIELYANYNPNVYTISLDDTNEIKLLYDHNYQKNNIVITKIDVPTKANNVFAGYYQYSNGTGKKYIDEDGNIKATNKEFLSDTTIYAKWIDSTINYNITIDNNNGEDVINTFISGGSKLNITTPTKNGFTFVEWQNNGVKFDINTQVESNLSLKAVWKYNDVMLRYASNNVFNADYQNNMNHLDSIIKTYDNSKDEYTVTMNANGTLRAYLGGNGNKKYIGLIANFGVDPTTLVNYNLTRISANGANYGIEACDVTDASSFGGNNPFDFVVWLDTTDNNKRFIFETNDGVLYKLNIKINEKKWLVSFNANSGSGNMDTVEVISGDTYILPLPTFIAPAGKSFTRWYQGLTPINEESIVVENDISLSAGWE